LSAPTKLRFKASVTAQVDAFNAFQESDTPVLCRNIEKALELMYLRQANPATPASELDELAFHIDRLRTMYRQHMPDGLARFDAGRRV